MPQLIQIFFHFKVRSMPRQYKSVWPLLHRFPNVNRHFKHFANSFETGSRNAILLKGFGSLQMDQLILSR